MTVQSDVWAYQLGGMGGPNGTTIPAAPAGDFLRNTRSGIAYLNAQVTRVEAAAQRIETKLDTILAALDNLPSTIAQNLPITIEGASGEYLLSLMQQLQNNVNREITMVNGNIIQVTNNQTTTLLDAINAN